MRKIIFVGFVSIFLFFISNLSFSENKVFGEEKEDVKEFSLAEISELALGNNLDIQIAKYETYIGRQNLKKARSIFDTYLSLNAGYYDDQTKKSSLFSGNKNVNTDYSIGLSKKFSTGTTVSLKGSQQRSWTDSGYVSINPYKEARAEVSVSQPIGENFFGLKDRLEVKKTKLDIESIEWLSLDSIEESLAEVQKAYWHLVFKNRALAIKKDMLERAKELFKVYKGRYSRGLAEAPDLLATQANTEVRKTDVSTAELEKETAKNDLLFLLNEDNTEIVIKPRNSLSVKGRKVSLPSVIAGAVKNRWDYKIAKNNLKSSDVSLVMKKNSLWPEIDLSASFVRNGLTGEYKDSWEDVSSESNPEFFVGVEFSLPLENKKAEAEAKTAELEKEKSILNLKKVERNIFREVRNRASRVNTWVEKVKSLKKIVDLQKKKLAAEKKRFNYGRSSSDLLIRYQEDLLQARLSLAGALLKYRLSLIDLNLTKGVLLDKYWQGEL